ncbi:AI-2E family transporter [Methylocella sp.]|jgi:predicted PurR-regulated permease PerM|uniref:AI-2E family transporter n=1 Tax=Methylocella sp. TaxID=1978226 RepID=UPI003C297780
MRLEWQIGFWIGALLLLILLLWLFSGVLLPFAAAMALSYLLNPVVDRLERLGLNRLGAVLLILAGFAVLLGLIMVLILPVFSRQLASFLESLPSYVVKIEDLGVRLANDHGASLLEKLGFGKAASADLRNSTSELVNQAAQWGGSFFKSIWSSGAALIGVVSLLVLTPVVTFYMLLDWEKMVATVDSLVPLRHRQTVRGLARQIDAAMAGFLRGQSLVCLFLGVWYGVGLSLIGLNFGLLIGISAGFLSFIPYVGSLTALILSAIVAIVQGWPEWRLLAMALGVVLAGQFLEGNVLSPKLVGGSVGLHPVWLIFALLAFGSLFGFTGLIVAVPLAAAVGVILRFAVGRYRESKLYTEIDAPGSTILIESSAVGAKERG